MTISGGSFGAISKPPLSAGGELGGNLIGGIGARRAAGGDQRRRRHRQLGRGRRLGEIAAVVDRVLDLVDEVLDRLLALVGGELGGDFGARRGERLAALRLDRIDLDDVPAEIRLDRPDDRARGGANAAAAALSPATDA